MEDAPIPPLLAGRGYVTESEMARMLSRAPTTLRNQRSARTAPPHVMVAGQAYYNPDQVMAALEARPAKPRKRPALDRVASGGKLGGRPRKVQP